MRIAILSANLGNFDTPERPVKQNLPPGVDVVYHCFTDNDFPPISGLTPRFQYRIPKLFGWEMYPGYDIYIWVDGVFSLQNPDSVKWFLEQLETSDIAVFQHPYRKNIQEEVEHIELKLKQGSKYITSRYNNGLHREMFEKIKKNPKYIDMHLFTSTVFIYRNNEKVQEMMKSWWYYQSRYFTCDQIAMPYAMSKHPVTVSLIKENQYKIPYLTEVSKHK